MKARRCHGAQDPVQTRSTSGTNALAANMASRARAVPSDLPASRYASRRKRASSDWSLLSALALACALLMAGCARQESVQSEAPATAGGAPQAAPETSTPAPLSLSVPETARAKTEKPAEVAPYAALPEWEGAGWQPLFDGFSLDGLKVTEFAGHGTVKVKEGLLVLEMGAMLTGVNLLKTNDIPAWNYELALDAMKTTGQDFFCGLTFVVGDSCCSFIVGGWGGGLVGISSLDGSDASMNETTKYKAFESNQWYRIRVRVTRAKLEAWIGREKMADVELEGKRISVRPGEIEDSQPFGIATFQTTGAFRNIQWRKLK